MSSILTNKTILSFTRNITMKAVSRWLEHLVHVQLKWLMLVTVDPGVLMSMDMKPHCI